MSVNEVDKRNEGVSFCQSQHWGVRVDSMREVAATLCCLGPGDEAKGDFCYHGYKTACTSEVHEANHHVTV